jgi:hypothetical protein
MAAENRKGHAVNVGNWHANTSNFVRSRAAHSFEETIFSSLCNSVNQMQRNRCMDRGGIVREAMLQRRGKASRCKVQRARNLAFEV